MLTTKTCLSSKEYSKRRRITCSPSNFININSVTYALICKISERVLAGSYLICGRSSGLLCDDSEKKAT